MHRFCGVVRKSRTPTELQHLTATALAAAQACSRRYHQCNQHYSSNDSIHSSGIRGSASSGSQGVAHLGRYRGNTARQASCISCAVTTAARHIAHYHRGAAAAWNSSGVESRFYGMQRCKEAAAAAALLSPPRRSSSGMLAKSSSPFRLYSTTAACRGSSETSSTCARAASMGIGAVGRPSRVLLAPKSASSDVNSSKSSSSGAVDVTRSVTTYREEKKEDEEQQREEEDPLGGNSGPGYLPFRPPFHTINIIMILFIANIVSYLIMRLGDDDWRDWMVEHFTISHENWTKVYPLFTNAFYQENLFQLLIDCWLLWQFGETMLNFIGNLRLTFLATLCTVGGGLLHVARQKFELYHGLDELEVRGRCYGPNTFIMGLIAVEGLVFRHLNFIQQPPVPFLVLTAFVMVIDVWRIFTTTPTEHGSATGGALVAYLFWALPTRALGLDKLTAAL